MRAHLEKAMAARGNRPLFVMDLGVPRNIDPTASSLYNFYLYNIDDLTQIVQQNRTSREGEVPRAEVIVDQHVGKFLSWQASVEIMGVVEALRDKLKSERGKFIRERSERITGLTPEQREQVESLIDDLLEKMLLDPARRLQGEKDLRRKIQQVEAIRGLFLSDRER
jgi:glutamyl-tRNA reductase